MKVILTQEVKGKGHEGDVVDVARGYAVNYLLPRKLAIHATSGNLKQLEARTSNIAKRNDERRSAAESVAAAIEGKVVIIEGKAGEEGKLFGSVTTTMIEEAIATQLDADVDHRRMDLVRPIKELGDYDVAVSVYGDVRATLTVRVVGEGGTEAAAEAAAPEAEAADEAPADEAPADDTDEAVDEPVAEAAAEPVEEIDSEE